MTDQRVASSPYSMVLLAAFGVFSIGYTASNTDAPYLGKQPTTSRPVLFADSTPTNPSDARTTIRSLKGKYAFVDFSSEDYVHLKSAEFLSE